MNKKKIEENLLWIYQSDVEVKKKQISHHLQSFCFLLERVDLKAVVIFQFFSF
jgi:hypothetical protein